MKKLLQTSLGMKLKDASWLVSHAKVEMVAPGSFSGQNWTLMRVGIGCSCGSSSPAPPGLASLEVTHLLPPVPLPLLRLHTDPPARANPELLDLLNLPLENLHHLWGRKCSINTEQGLWDAV